MSISPTWTRALTDPELVQQTTVIRDHLNTITPNDAQRAGATENLHMLEAEAERRTAAQTLAGLRLGPHATRPPGLPDGGFALVELPDVPAAGLDLVPEGQVTTLTSAALYGALPAASAGPVGGGAVTRGVQATGSGGGAGALASGINMARWGFPGGAQSQFTVGIVVRPRANSLDWGHTSLTLRRGGGMPLETVGFNPDMRTAQGLLDIARNYKQVEAGKYPVRGRITSDSSMFTNADSVHVEYVISEADAAQFAMAKPGRVPTLDYVARPAVYRAAPGACSGSNCGLWAIGEIEGQTGGTVGRVGDPAGITSMGRGGSVTAGRGSQPAIVDMARGGLSEPGSISPLRPGGAAPIVSGMPRVVRVLRVGGKVMLVVGVVAGAYEIVTARPEERNRTIVGVAGGFAGGFALGATAGLLCGPGAPVCSFVLGLGLGTLGALGGRAGAEALYDAASTSPAASTSTPSGQPSTSARGPSSPDITSWEFMFAPPPEPVNLLFSRAIGGTPLVRPATSLDMAFVGGPSQ